MLLGARNKARHVIPFRISEKYRDKTGGSERIFLLFEDREGKRAVKAFAEKSFLLKGIHFFIPRKTVRVNEMG
ncbi:hypothetical protein FTO70_10535 [Methanosarcina sp. KYL-1]|uniref:hypothetical protein n=1 Tax=Methanosarcina sp. KYL-1 TaxID=2602068 RepID=UPI002101632B|nr:hypothetical protein [Methanosarcina sp. KYL-1]MCQ1536107.1 hypothetical protein [Methanosarcina sp. KYL-1]